MKRITVLSVLVLFILTGCRTSTAGYNYEAAKVQYSQKKYDKALEYIDKSIKADAKAEYYLFKGDIFYKLDKFEDAVTTYDMAIGEATDTKALENNKQAHTKKAILYIDNDKFEEASASIEEALKITVLEELTKELMLYKMDTLLYLKKYKEAAQCGAEFAGKYTDGEDRAKAYIKIARAYGYVNDVEGAMGFFDKALKEKDYTAYYYRAQLYETNGEYQKAFDDYEEFLKESKAEVKYSIYAKQIDCLFKLAEKTVDEEVFDLIEKTIKTAMISQEEKHIKVFGKKYIAFLERKGEYEEAYVYAREYLAQYPDDEAINNEIKFLETRIIEAE